MKTDITPIIDNLHELKGSDVKVLNVLYQRGAWLEPEKIAIETGLNKRTVQRSLDRPIVKHLISCKDEKSELDQFFMNQWQEFKRLVEGKKNGQKIQ